MSERGMATLPVNMALPRIVDPSRAVVGDVLEVADGEWFGDDLHMFHQWWKNDRAIARARYRFYVCEESDVGCSVRCQVTACNRAGSSSWSTISVVVNG